jgi:PAS domain S-box-containing protein
MLTRTGDGVFIIDGTGRISGWNDAAARIMRYTAAEVLGRPCAEVFAGYDADGNRLCDATCRMRALVTLGEAVRAYDMQTTIKGGGTVWLNVSVLSMPPMIVHLFRDVTVQRRVLTLLRDRVEAVGPPAAPSPTALRDTLTAREADILRLLAEGMPTATIARRLCRSPATIRNHIQSILRKLDAHSRLEAIAIAMRRNWLGTVSTTTPSPRSASEVPVVAKQSRRNATEHG